MFSKGINMILFLMWKNKPNSIDLLGVYLLGAYERLLKDYKLLYILEYCLANKI